MGCHLGFGVLSLRVIAPDKGGLELELSFWIRLVLLSDSDIGFHVRLVSSLGQIGLDVILDVASLQLI